MEFKRIGNFIKFLFAVMLGIAFIPPFLGLYIPSVKDKIPIPVEYLTVFLVSFVGFYLLYLYGLLKGKE